jgi:hypothetical protein
MQYRGKETIKMKPARKMAGTAPDRKTAGIDLG